MSRDKGSMDKVLDDEAVEIITQVAGLLERLGVAYFVGGSLASSFHGIPRATQDADFAAALRAEHVEPLTAALSQSFYVSDERIHDAVRRQTSFNVIHLETLFKVDIFCVGADPYSKAELDRRQKFSLRAGETLEVASAEDTILHKLVWYRQGGEVSDRQWADLLGVFKVQGSRLEIEYLRRWAEALGVADLLEHAFEKTDFGS